MELFLKIAKHFASVGALALAVLQVKKIITKGQGGKQKAIKKTKSYRLLANPDSQFEPATPAWIGQAAEWAVSGLPLDTEVPEPPEVARAVAEVDGPSGVVRLGDKSLLKDLFVLRQGVHYLNAGSYGGVFRLAATAQKWYQDLLEEQPCFFNERIGPVVLQAAKRCVADYIRAAEGDVVHLQNATAAVNTVLNSVELRPGDLVLTTSISYAAVRNAAARFASRAGAGVIEVLLDLATLQAGSAAVCECFRRVLAQWGSRIKLAVIDHVTSNPTVHLPVAQIAALCRASDIKVCVDGAHAVGAVPLDVPSLGVQYYTSNLHKWACCPKSAAFLWVAASEQPTMVPLVTSHGYKRGFQAEFAWQGTSDVSAWLAVPTALRLQQALGVERCRSHNHAKLKEAVALLRAAWGTQIAVLGADAPKSHMASIELPFLPDFPPKPASASQLHAHLLDERSIEVMVSVWEDRLWVRISAQIYNMTADYEALRDAVAELMAPVRHENGTGGGGN